VTSAEQRTVAVERPVRKCIRERGTTNDREGKTQREKERNRERGRKRDKDGKKRKKQKQTNADSDRKAV
jgi:hypothetical protein